MSHDFRKKKQGSKQRSFIDTIDYCRQSLPDLFTCCDQHGGSLLYTVLSIKYVVVKSKKSTHTVTLQGCIQDGSAAPTALVTTGVY